MRYKSDARGVLEQSVMRSEAVQEKINDDAKQLRMIMRYRLFGRDGVTKMEFKDLIDLKIVKKRPDYND